MGHERTTLELIVWTVAITPLVIAAWVMILRHVTEA